MKIVMVASESNPFIKTGGLADVTYGLSKELAKLEHDVSLFIPLYNSIRSMILLKAKAVASFDIHMSWRKEGTTIYKYKKDGINFYFVENRHYFERDNVYGYYDDGERFAFYSLAVVKALETLKIKPNIIHTHDWQSAIIPCLIKEKKIEFFAKTKFVLTIHNPAFLGYLHKIALGDLFGLKDELYDNGNVRFNDQVSTLKAGIYYSDKIAVVSPTHHYELLTKESGMGLEGILNYRKDDFVGILNGLDIEEFDPNNDKNIIANFSNSSFRSGKAKNKKDLCDKLGITLMDKPMFALVSRVTWQKGMDLVFPACYALAEKGCNIVLLGSGEDRYEKEMQALQNMYPDRVAIFIGYNNKLAHMVYAASDFFLMPSLFEPCGLGQMIAHRYGSLPIVRRVGGLRDSVVPYDGNNVEQADGFGFDEYSVYEMVRTVNWAYDNYFNKTVFNKLVKNAMNADHSWRVSVLEYIKLYESLIN